MKWDEAKYQRITSSKYQGGQIIIAFEDGDVFSLKPETLLSTEQEIKVIGDIKFNPFDITIPTQLGEIEVSWQTIRTLVDKEFARYLSREAEKEEFIIGQKLRELRIRKKISSKDLAANAGITPQSLSRIERGHHDIAFKTLRRLLFSMNYTLADLSKTAASPPSLNSVLKKLNSYGLNRELLLDKILSKDLIDRLQKGIEPSIKQRFLKLLFRPTELIFGWTLENLESDQPLKFDSLILQTAKFKTPGRTQEKRAIAYAVYAHYLAGLVVQTTTKSLREFPTNPNDVRKYVIKYYGELNFKTFLQFLWDSGIPVLPLQDPGAFHGACWKIKNRPIIVLKQLTAYHARWLYDLIHEFGHVVKHLSKPETNLIIEREEINPFTRDQQEEEANDFADELLLYGKAEEFAKKCVELSKGKVELLKSSLPKVSASEHIPVDVLANYMAFRLSLQGINWWGAANNLQENDPLPWEIANDFLWKYIDIKSLNPEDSEILIRAIVS